VKLVYVTSYFQNPTGLTLSAERRPRLLEIVKRFSRRNRILILEDAAYRELCYEGVGLPSIKSYDADNLHTILACTFSKPFAPGLRTGYTAMPGDLMEAVLRQKGNHDFGSASLNQHLLLEAMNSGVYQAQVKRLCDTYRLKRDEMLLALDRHMPRVAGLRWTRPAGGLYVWLTLPDGMDTSRHAKLFESALNHGVLYVPGDYCYQPDEAGSTPKNHIRLSYGNVAIGDIAPGVERLAAVIKGQIAADPFHVGHEHGSVHSGATGRGASRDAVASIGAVAAIGASGAATSAGVVATRESVASIDAVAAGGGSAR
jgi:2-aminoadipate transaminase